MKYSFIERNMKFILFTLGKFKIYPASINKSHPNGVWVCVFILFSDCIACVSTPRYSQFHIMNYVFSFISSHDLYVSFVICVLNEKQKRKKITWTFKQPCWMRSKYINVWTIALILFIETCTVLISITAFVIYSWWFLIQIKIVHSFQMHKIRKNY